MKLFCKTTGMRLLQICSFFLLFIGLHTSCSNDDSSVSGCTDPLSLNYNSNATKDDGSCTYERDQFLGRYEGKSNCPNDATFSQDPFIFNITADPDDVQKVKFSYVADRGTLSHAGMVDGNQLTFLGEPIWIPIGFQFNGKFYTGVSLSITGTATLNGDNFVCPTFSFNVHQNGQIVDRLSCSLEGMKTS